MSAIRRSLTLAAALTLALGLAACGGGSSVNCSSNPTGPGCPPPPPPTPPPPFVVTQGQFALEFDALLWAIFNTTQAGTINGEVQWTYPTNTMLIVVTEGACTAQQLIDQQCRMIHTSLGTAPKPRTFSLPGRAAGTHTLMVGNAGPGDDAIAYQVVLNPSASAAASAEAAPPAASLGTLDLRRFKRHVSAARP